MISLKRTIIRLGRGLICLLPVVCALLLLMNLLPGVVGRHEPDIYTAKGIQTEIKPVTVPNPEDAVNINTASAAELDALPGVGPAIAQSIINEREANGPYFYPEDLMDAKGIGEGKYNAVKHLITTGE